MLVDRHVPSPAAISRLCRSRSKSCFYYTPPKSENKYLPAKFDRFLTFLMNFVELLLRYDGYGRFLFFSSQNCRIFLDFLKFQSPEQNLRIDIARIRVYNKACRRVCHIKRSTQNLPRGHSSLVEYQLPKLRRRVRFPLSAPN